MEKTRSKEEERKKKVVIDFSILRKNRIEELKEMINNEEYLKEAIGKLANSLTTGLMK